MPQSYTITRCTYAEVGGAPDCGVALWSRGLLSMYCVLDVHSMFAPVFPRLVLDRELFGPSALPPSKITLQWLTSGATQG